MSPLGHLHADAVADRSREVMVAASQLCQLDAEGELVGGDTDSLFLRPRDGGAALVDSWLEGLPLGLEARLGHPAPTLRREVVLDRVVFAHAKRYDGAVAGNRSHTSVSKGTVGASWGRWPAVVFTTLVRTSILAAVVGQAWFPLGVART